MSEYIFGFPFSKIERGERCIIFAANEIGEFLAFQNDLKGYCEILCFIDESDSKKECHGHIVCKKEKLISLDYDKIIVASVTYSKVIKAELAELRVPEGKIIDFIYINYNELFIEFKSIKDMNEILGIYIKQNKSNNRFVNEFIPLFVKYVIQEAEFKIETVVRSNLNAKEVLNILYFVFQRNPDIMNPELLQRICKVLAEVNDMLPFLGEIMLDLSLVVWNNQNYLYSDYYSDKRKVMVKYADYLYKKYNFDIKKNNNEVKRIAVVGYQLTMDRLWSAPSKLLIAYSNGLSERGYAVEVFLEDSMARFDEDISTSILPSNESYMSCDFLIYSQKYVNSKIRIITSKEKRFELRMTELARKLENYQPDVILNCSDEYSMLSYLFLGKIKVAHLFLAGCRATIPAKIQLTGLQKNTVDKEICGYSGLDRGKIISLPFGFVSQKDYVVKDRGYYKLSEDQFVLVTVGHNLNSFLSDVFIDEMCNMLKDNPSFVWWIIGPDLLLDRMVRYQSFLENGRIKLSEYEDNLPGIYRISDLYINPERKGGGWGVAQAITDGLPVLTTTNSTAGLSWVGKENAIDGGVAELIETIVELNRDKDKYQTWVLRMNERSREIDIERAIDAVAENITNRGERNA